MISLEQIRLLESKITRAIELIRILKEENGTLRRGLESAQKRMKELETLVDGFKTDQREIESVIIRTLHNLDELEESAATGRKADNAGAGAPIAPPAPSPADPKNPIVPGGQEPRPPKEELDIF
jgi:FtsZ-binding cell division protein ZapB